MQFALRELKLIFLFSFFKYASPVIQGAYFSYKLTVGNPRVIYIVLFY